jgi:hypothetical protein
VDGGVDDGDGWPFPDGRLARPLHTWLSVGAMKDGFTAEAVGVRRGASVGGQQIRELDVVG